MPVDYDIVIRGGLVVDGTGGEPFHADVAILERVKNIRLKKRGDTDFTSYEKGDGVGGTGREKHYPGLADFKVPPMITKRGATKLPCERSSPWAAAVGISIAKAFRRSGCGAMITSRQCWPSQSLRITN